MTDRFLPFMEVIKTATRDVATAFANMEETQNNYIAARDKMYGTKWKREAGMSMMELLQADLAEMYKQPDGPVDQEAAYKAQQEEEDARDELDRLYDVFTYAKRSYHVALTALMSAFQTFNVSTTF